MTESKKLWLDEISRETEHYFQSEVQQDQRASWLLAISGVLIAVVVSLVLAALDRGYRLPSLFTILSLVAFVVSSCAAVVTFLPLRGIRHWFSDLFGQGYRRILSISIDQMTEERFRYDSDWSPDSYEARIKYHFRSHYLRNILKSYGVLWSSIFLLVGLVGLAIVLISLVLQS